MRMNAEDVRRLIVRTLCRHRLPEAHARITADVLVEAELRGRKGHGLARLEGIADMCDALGEEPVLAADRGAAACIDGRHYLGYVACYTAAQEACKRATRYGLSVVGLRRTRHMGMLGYYVDWLARHDLVALAFADCWPLVAPHGGVERVLGTNPIAAAFPHEPFRIVIDTGTAAITYGDILVAKAGHRPLPEGAAVDAEGRPTTDPDAAREGALLPFAGHRGYIFGLMAQLLAGALPLGNGLPLARDDYGTLILAMRTDLFGDASVYRAEVAKLADALHGARRREGVDEILLPGERAWCERERRLRDGIEVDDDFLRRAESL